MKKVVLTTLLDEEVSLVESCKSKLTTFYALLHNQFIDEDEKKQINKNYRSAKDELDKVFDVIFTKYKIPESVKPLAMVSYDKKELYMYTSGG